MKFSYYLIPTEEFLRELRAYGVQVIVRSPDWIVQQFRADNKLLYEIHNGISPE